MTLNPGSCSTYILDFVHPVPGGERIESSFRNPEYLREHGYTGQVLDCYIQAAVPMISAEPDMFPLHTEERQWIDRYSSTLETRISALKDAGLDAYANMDVVVLPRKLVDLHREHLTAARAASHEYDIKGDFTPDIHEPLLQEFLRIQIDEIFSRFPGLDGVVVRVGETYLHDLPYHTGGDPISQGVESHRVLIELLRECVCVKNNRTLFYRTWMSGIDEDPAAYLQATSKIEPHPKLIFSFKHCVGDFHRSHPFNPVLGTGAHRQLVEVQCQREYEGKGAYPNYISEGVIDGFEEYENLMPVGANRSLRDIMDHETFAGVWLWSRGGGWKGPHIKNEFWCALNARVLAIWANNPVQSTAACFNQFCREEGFEGEDRDRLLQICRLASSAVLHGTASENGGINTLWSRDQYMGGLEDQDSPMADAVARIVADDRVEEIIAERELAVQLWHEIEAIAKDILNVSEVNREHIVSSCRYGRINYEIFAAGWTILLLGYLGDLNGMYDWQRINAALKRYDAAWEEWHQLTEASPSCATVYDSNYCRYVGGKGMFPYTGMGDSIERYRNMQQLDNSPAATPHINLDIVKEKEERQMQL